MSDSDAIDFFHDDSVRRRPVSVLRSTSARSARCSGSRTHGVMMVTGYDEAVAVYHDTATFSACNAVSGPFPGFPVPLVGDDVSALIDAVPRPAADERPAADVRSADAHRAPRAAHAADHAEAAEGERGVHVAARRSSDRRVHRQRRVRVHQRVRGAVRDARGRRPARRARDRPRAVPRARLGPRRTAARSAAPATTSRVHSPLEFLYEQFTTYVEDRRRDPRDDVLTGLATASFPDGSTPDVIDVVRIAANLFAAGQETTVRLLGTALLLIGERPELQQLLRTQREHIANFVEETLRIESPIKGDFRLARRRDDHRRRRHPGRHHRHGPQRCREPRPAALRVSRASSASTATTHGNTSRSVTACIRAPVPRSRAPKRACQRRTPARPYERHPDLGGGTRPARRAPYQYAPTHILRGLRSLSLEFDASTS